MRRRFESIWGDLAWINLDHVVKIWQRFSYKKTDDKGDALEEGDEIEKITVLATLTTGEEVEIYIVQVDEKIDESKAIQLADSVTEDLTEDIDGDAVDIVDRLERIANSLEGVEIAIREHD